MEKAIKAVPATTERKPKYKIGPEIGLLLVLIPTVIGAYIGSLSQGNSGFDVNNIVPPQGASEKTPPQVATEWGWRSPLEIWAMCGTQPDKPYAHISSTCRPGDDVRLPPLDLTAHLDSWRFEGPASGTIKTRFPMPQKP